MLLQYIILYGSNGLQPVVLWIPNARTLGSVSTPNTSYGTIYSIEGRDTRVQVQGFYSGSVSMPRVYTLDQLPSPWELLYPQDQLSRLVGWVWAQGLWAIDGRNTSMDRGYRVKGPIELYAVPLELDHYQHPLCLILYRQNLRVQVPSLGSWLQPGDTSICQLPINSSIPGTAGPQSRVYRWWSGCSQGTPVSDHIPVCGCPIYITGTCTPGTGYLYQWYTHPWVLSPGYSHEFLGIINYTTPYNTWPHRALAYRFPYNMDKYSRIPTDINRSILRM